ncbi:protein phosphatase PTC7 [Cladorrhinum samala]|uniref:Protein phosphatase n=1 Tax=Cladorrhinum samala TaxID=585594 RepID=A0AAV9HLY2_9PEZI|nr:protein phosphatase PTC7 [Cladorrhinum samala]
MRRTAPRFLLVPTAHPRSRSTTATRFHSAQQAWKHQQQQPQRRQLQQHQLQQQQQHRPSLSSSRHERKQQLSTDSSSSSPSSSSPSSTAITRSASLPGQKVPLPLLDKQGRLDPSVFPKLPYRFHTGIGLFAKRPPRPFPPPFLSPPSGSFSDPLSTHDRSRDRRRAYTVDGQLIQGHTNGDDAVFASEYFIGANDGVGAWSTRPRGHAGLWARLILHFWATAIFQDAARRAAGGSYRPDPMGALQDAYEQTIEATSEPNDWQGTTTAAGAQLFYRRTDGGGQAGDVEPLLYVTNLGDSQVMVVRPSTREMVYKSTEQWHWFDCPRQLGTNSPDTPSNCAVMDEVPIREGDVVLAMSDGVIDNLWAHEIVDQVSQSLETWQKGDVKPREVMIWEDGSEEEVVDDCGMGYVAEELMEAAKAIAVDPFAESPFMERAIEEGLPSAGGKLDDISVVAAICKRNDS